MTRRSRRPGWVSSSHLVIWRRAATTRNRDMRCVLEPKLGRSCGVVVGDDANRPSAPPGVLVRVARIVGRGSAVRSRRCVDLRTSRGGQGEERESAGAALRRVVHEFVDVRANGHWERPGLAHRAGGWLEHSPRRDCPGVLERPGYLFVGLSCSTGTVCYSILENYSVVGSAGGSFLARVRRGVVGSPGPINLAANALACRGQRCIVVGGNKIATLASGKQSSLRTVPDTRTFEGVDSRSRRVLRGCRCCARSGLGRDDGLT